MKRNLLIGTSLVAAFASTDVDARSAAVMTNEALEANTQLASAIHIVTEGHKKSNATGGQALKASETSAVVAAYKELKTEVKPGEDGEVTVDAIAAELVKNPELLKIVAGYRGQIEAEVAAAKGEKLTPAPAPAPVVGVDLPGLPATVEGERAVLENLLTGKVKVLEAAEKKVAELKATEDAAKEAEADFKKAEVNVKEAEDRLAALKEKTENGQTSDSQLKAQIRSAESSVKTVKESLEESKKTLEAATKAWNAVKDEKAEAEADLEAAKKAKVDAEIYLEDLGKGTEEKAVAMASRALKAAEAEVNKLKSTEKAFKNAQDALGKAQNSFDKAKESLAGKGYPKAAEKALVEAQKVFDAAEKAWNEVKDGKAKADIALDDAKKVKAAAEKALAESKRTPEEKKDRAAAEQINNLKAKIEALEKAQSNAARLDAEIKEAKQTEDLAKAALAGAAADAPNRADLEKALKEATDRVAVLEKDRQEKAEEAATSKARFDQNRTIAALKTELKTTKEELDKAKQAADGNNSAELRAELGITLSTVARLEEELQAVKEELQAAEEEAAALEEEAAALEEEAAAFVPGRVLSSFIADQEKREERALADLTRVDETICKLAEELRKELDKEVYEELDNKLGEYLAERVNNPSKLGEICDLLTSILRNNPPIEDLKSQLEGIISGISNAELPEVELEELRNQKALVEKAINTHSDAEQLVKNIYFRDTIFIYISQLGEVLLKAKGLDLAWLSPVEGTEDKPSDVLAMHINAEIAKVNSMVASIHTDADLSENMATLEKVDRSIDSVSGYIRSFHGTKEWFDDLELAAADEEEASQTTAEGELRQIVKQKITDNKNRELYVNRLRQASFLVNKIDNFKFAGESLYQLLEKINSLNLRVVENRNMMPVLQILDLVNSELSGVRDLDERVKKLKAERTGLLAELAKIASEREHLSETTNAEIQSLEGTLGQADDASKPGIEAQIATKREALAEASRQLETRNEDIRLKFNNVEKSLINAEQFREQHTHSLKTNHRQQQERMNAADPNNTVSNLDLIDYALSRLNRLHEACDDFSRPQNGGDELLESIDEVVSEILRRESLNLPQPPSIPRMQTPPPSAALFRQELTRTDSVTNAFVGYTGGQTGGGFQQQGPGGSSQQTVAVSIPADPATVAAEELRRREAAELAAVEAETRKVEAANKKIIARLERNSGNVK